MEAGSSTFLSVGVKHGKRGRPLGVIGTTSDVCELRADHEPTPALLAKILAQNTFEDGNVQEVQRFLKICCTVKESADGFRYRRFNDDVADAGCRAFPAFSRKDDEWWRLQYKTWKSYFEAKALTKR